MEQFILEGESRQYFMAASIPEKNNRKKPVILINLMPDSFSETTTLYCHLS